MTCGPMLTFKNELQFIHWICCLYLRLMCMFLIDSDFTTRAILNCLIFYYIEQQELPMFVLETVVDPPHDDL